MQGSDGADCKDFNPHSRKGSDRKIFLERSNLEISIHTPARGVTDAIEVKVNVNQNFNPHSRKGSDRSGSRC